MAMTFPGRLGEIRTACEMRALIPASFDFLERVCAEFRSRAAGLLARRDSFIAELLLREALTNAVEHGSHGNAGSAIRVALRIKKSRMLIAVEDEGEGFDWRLDRSQAAYGTTVSGRGIEILHKYANRVRFNDRGNAVAVVREFVSEINEEVSQ
jgi:anti-sigma regulatory factor (Ser/Thr protein kinase)